MTLSKDEVESLFKDIDHSVETITKTLENQLYRLAATMSTKGYTNKIEVTELTNAINKLEANYVTICNNLSNSNIELVLDKKAKERSMKSGDSYLNLMRLMIFNARQSVHEDAKSLQ